MDQDLIEFITITRGGLDGLIAVVSINNEDKYFERLGLTSLLSKYTELAQQQELQKAINAIDLVEDLDEIPEFEGGLPVQGSLF